MGNHYDRSAPKVTNLSIVERTDGRYALVFESFDRTNSQISVIDRETGLELDTDPFVFADNVDDYWIRDSFSEADAVVRKWEAVRWGEFLETEKARLSRKGGV